MNGVISTAADEDAVTLHSQLDASLSSCYYDERRYGVTRLMREAGKMDDTRIKLTPALRRMLEFIARGEGRGRMIVQIVATGGRSVSQLDALRSAGYVEYYDPPEGGPDRIRITAAGRDAFAHQASLRYRRDDDRYLVYLDDDRIGFVRYSPANRRWNAADTTMSYSRWFDTRDAAGKALHRRFTKMTRDGRL